MCRQGQKMPAIADDCRRFEPWLAGDRRMEKRLAKARIRCKGLPVKSVCREWLGALLAAERSPVYRLRTNRGVRACEDLTAGAFFCGKPTDDNRNCPMPRQFT